MLFKRMLDKLKSQTKSDPHKTDKGHAHKGDANQVGAPEDYGAKMREKIVDRRARNRESA
jgi:hypothetical protein